MNIITVKQAFEWVKTGHWTLSQFSEWVKVVQEDAFVHGEMVAKGECK